MAEKHVPDEFLMKRCVARLKGQPLSIGNLSIMLNQRPGDIRQALSDLMHFGKVEKHSDGYRYQVVGLNHSPGPDGGDVA